MISILVSEIVNEYVNFKFVDNLSRVPGRVLGQCVTRLGLNDGAKIWISLKLFSYTNFSFIAHIRENISFGANFEGDP